MLYFVNLLSYNLMIFTTCIFTRRYTGRKVDSTAHNSEITATPRAMSQGNSNVSGTLVNSALWAEMDHPTSVPIRH